MKDCTTKYCSKNALVIAGLVLFMAVGYLLFAKPTNSSTAMGAATETPAYLFVQSAQKGSLQAQDATQNLFTLTLNQVEPQMSYFTDQPLRETGMISVEKFVQVWKDRPNVVVHAVNDKTKKSFNLIFALSKPLYNKQTQSLTYQAELLGSQKLDSQVMKMDHTTIFIDDLRWHGNIFDPHGTNGN